MVFSNATFLFLFLPIVIFLYWLPDIILKIKSIICSYKLDNKEETIDIKSNSKKSKISIFFFHIFLSL